MTRIDRIPVSCDTRAPTGDTNAYVLDGSVLVDPAAPHRAVDAALDDLSDVVVTHAHPDHVGGVSAYADRATVWCHADHVDRFRGATGVAPDRRFREGDRVGPAEVLATPGHAPDHVSLLVSDPVDGPDDSGDSDDPGADTDAAPDADATVASDPAAPDASDAPGGGRRAASDPGSGPVALVGDLAVAEGSVAVAAPDGDVTDYLRSLRRLRDRHCRRLLPGHGPPIGDPRATLTRLIDHRLDRERRVLAAVESGARTPEAVTDRAYEKDLSGVRDLATAAVVAHLRRLDEEGRVRFDGDRVRPA